MPKSTPDLTHRQWLVVGVMGFCKDDLVDRAVAAASARTRGDPSSHSCSAREATKYIAKCLLELSACTQMSDSLLKEVDCVIQATVVLQHRRQFCESTFRHTILPHSNASSLGKYGLSLEHGQEECILHPTVIWSLSEAGLLSFHFDYLLVVDGEFLRRLAHQLLACEENIKGGALGGKYAQVVGKILRFVVEAAATTTSILSVGERRPLVSGSSMVACERSLQILGDLRELWSGRASALTCAVHATKSAFSAVSFSSFWMNEMKCHLLGLATDQPVEGAQAGMEESKRQERVVISEALEKMCELVFPGVLVEHFCKALRDVMVSKGAQPKLDCVAHCIRVFSDMQVENSKDLQLLFFELGSEAFSSSDAVLLSNVLLSNQKSIEVLAASDSGLFRRWLKDFMQNQIDRCKASASGYNPARVTQFILKVFNEFVPTESPSMLLAHKEVMKTLNGLNDLYVRDYCNLVQARLNDFNQVEIPGITEEGIKEVARQESAFCNNDFEVPDSVVLKARMWTPTWWKRTILPVLKMPPETKRGQILRGQYMEALVRKELLPESVLTKYKEACEKMSIEESVSAQNSLSQVKFICGRINDALMSANAVDLENVLPEVKLGLTAYASQLESAEERDEFCSLVVDSFWTSYSSTYSRRYGMWGNAAQQTVWMCAFLQLIEGIEILKMNFLAKIVSLISVCAADLGAEQIAALASLLVNMSLVSLSSSSTGGQTEQKPLFNWNFEGKDELKPLRFSHCHWIEHLFGKLKLHTAQLREFACRLSISYISHTLQFSSFVLTPKGTEKLCRCNTECLKSAVIPILALEILSWVQTRFISARGPRESETNFYNLMKRFFESEMMQCIGAIYKVNELQLLRPPG